MERGSKIAPGRCANEERADDARDHAGSRDGNREDDSRPWVSRPGEDNRAQDDRRDDGPDVRLEQVGAHAGHVADVVADVICDDCGVARVVLGDSGLHFANEVGADVGRLRVDAAPDTREQRDATGAEAVGGDQRGGVGNRQSLDEDEKQHRQPQQAEPGDAEAHHGPTAEGKRQRALDAAQSRRLRGPRVGRRRDLHADEPGSGRGNGAHDIRKRSKGTVVRDHEDQHSHDRDEDRENAILAPQKRHRALPDRVHQLTHALVSRIGCQYLAREQRSETQARDCGDARRGDHPTHGDTVVEPLASRQLDRADYR